MQSTAKADANSSVVSDVQPSLSPVIETNDSGTFVNGHIGFGDYGGMGRGCQGNDGFGEFGTIHVSSDFTQNVTNIAKNGTDVQNLLI